MATWDELGNEEDFDKDEEQVNLNMMDLTSSGIFFDSDYG